MRAVAERLGYIRAKDGLRARRTKGGRKEDGMTAIERLRARLREAVPGRPTWLEYDEELGLWCAGVLWDEEEDLVDEEAAEDAHTALERLGYTIGLDLRG